MFNPKTYYLRKSVNQSSVELPLKGVTSFSAIVVTYSGSPVVMSMGENSVVFDDTGASRTVTSSSTQYIVSFKVSGGRSTDDIKTMTNLSAGYIMNRDVLKRLFMIEALEVTGTNDASILTGDWSLEMPKLKEIVITIHAATTSSVTINFDRPGFFPVLEVLEFRANQGKVLVKGEAKYLPATLKRVSSGSYTNSSGFIGKLSDFPSGIEVIDLFYQNGNSIVGYDAKTWTGNLASIGIKNVGLASSELDQLLIDLSNATWKPSGEININRGNKAMAVRTSASNAAVAILQSKGVSIKISNNTF